MANLQETLKTYNEKKAAMDEKIEAQTQELRALLADIEALPEELKGQSEEYINRQRKILEKKIESKTQKYKIWAEEQKKKIENWMKIQQDKIQKGIDDMLELEKQTAQSVVTLQSQIVLSVLTGQKIQEILPEQTDDTPVKTIPPIPERKDDIEFQYSYKNSLGQMIACLGSDAAKRKNFDSSKVYTIDDDILRKSNIFRKKYVWTFTWTHGSEEIKEINGQQEIIVKQDKIISSETSHLSQTLSELFSSIDGTFQAKKQEAMEFFKKTPNNKEFHTSINHKNGNKTDIWNLFIFRTI